VGEGPVVKLHQTIVVVICGWMHIHAVMQNTCCCPDKQEICYHLVHLAAGNVWISKFTQKSLE